MTTKTPRTAAALDARRRNTQAKLQRVKDAITVLRRQKAPITYPAVARRAEVSRTFLYENTDARTLISDALDRAGSAGRTTAHHDEQQEPLWRERALNAEDALKAAHAEIRTGRERIATLLGQIRDLQQQWSDETAQQLTTENANLKQRLRQLTHDNRTLDERLQAARSNNRFQDRKIAQLEAQLLDQSHQQR